MGVGRLSISVPPDVEADIRTAAARAGVPVSAWLARVAMDAARIEDGRRAVREFEAEHGSLGERDRAQARRVLNSLGLTPATDQVAG